MKIDFVGPSYQYRSTNFDAQRSINLYMDKSAIGTSKDSLLLCPTPGRQLFSTLPVQSIRGMWATSYDRAFVVAYNTFYEVFSDGTYTSRGTIDTFSGNVSMSDNGLQIIIVDGTPTGGWIFTLDDNTLEQITDDGFSGGTTVTFIDGYFLLNIPNTGQYQWSALYDGTSWDGADVANAEGSPDALIAVATIHRQTYLMGDSTVQVIDNTGASPDPFESVQGVFLEYGLIAPFAIQQVANTILWIGKDISGANVVWMVEGYSPKRISTTPVEYYLSQYDLTACTSYSYQEDGHYFVEWSAPEMPTSVVYDITMEQWHERARWNTSSGRYERDRANFHMFVFGLHLVSDYENGNIYEQNLRFNKDDDTLIRRLRRSPYFTDDLEYLYISKFQLDMQTGVGLTSDSDEANVNPQVNLRWSDDGGHTWSTYLSKSIGRIGQYNTRAIWFRLGRTRARVWEVTIDANVPVYMIAAHIDASKGYA